MGPQSSGKSTLAKIVSYCQWAEKRFLLDGEYEYDVEEQLLEFHRLSINYFSQSSKIYYESGFVTIDISLTDENKIFERITSKNMNVHYKKTKNIYIPAERNFVSVIPNLGRYKETNDNIMSFLYDWYSTKKKYTVENNLPILNLNVDYYHVEETDSDVLVLNNTNEELNLRNGSSGLQSVIPLLMIVDYLSEKFYEETHRDSNDELNSLKNQAITKQFLDEFIRVTATGRKTKNKSVSRLTVDEFFRFIEKRSQYDHTQFIMEEPEQNLFPETQRDLVYHILKKVRNSEKKHSLFITTHSPYILYSINNCLMGFNVKGKMPVEEQKELKSYGSWINPDDVDIYQLRDGQLFSIKDERTKTVTKHYFNENLNEILDEYYELLSYFSYDDK